MWLQRLELPLALEKTTALALVPSVTFAQGEDGQHMRLKYFDGRRRLGAVLRRCRRHVDRALGGAMPRKRRARKVRREVEAPVRQFTTEERLGEQ